MAVDEHTISGTPAQLIEVYATINGQTTSWTYDSLGNRISESRYRGTSSTVDHEYYDSTSLLKKRGDWLFNYDANGNLIERGKNGTWNASSGRYTWTSSEGELWTYGYDLKNRLVEVRHGKNGSASLINIAAYTYDSRDLRVMTLKSGTTTYYQYDQEGDLVWSETSGSTTKYVQALGEVWAEIRTESSVSTTYYHATDHLGSTELITDANGKIVWSANYEPFGAITRSNGELSFSPSFTGKQLDEDTGLYYFNARWYDPQLGRFISEDPARDGDNWVAYVGNRPLVYTDPDGRQSKSAIATAKWQSLNNSLSTYVSLKQEVLTSIREVELKIDVLKGGVDSLKHEYRMQTLLDLVSVASIFDESVNAASQQPTPEMMVYAFLCNVDVQSLAEYVADYVSAGDSRITQEKIERFEIDTNKEIKTLETRIKSNKTMLSSYDEQIKQIKKEMNGLIQED